MSDLNFDQKFLGSTWHLPSKIFAMYDIDLVFSPFPTARKFLQNPLYSLANTTSGLWLWGQYEFLGPPA